MNVSTKTLGFRELSPEELELVSGGDITVNAPRWEADPRDYYEYQFYNDGFYNDYDEYAYAGGGTEQPETILNASEQTSFWLGVLEDLNDRMGSNHPIKLLDGSTTTVGTLLSGAGKLNTAIDAGATLGEIENGSADVHAAYHFIFGMTVESAALAAGAGTAVSAAMGIAASVLADNAVDWMEKLGDARDELKAQYNEQMLEWVQQNSQIAPGTYNNEVDMLNSMFGWPRGMGPDNDIP